MADALFEDPRLAALYDLFDDDRRDIDAYVALATELGARVVLDVGCGTGTLACMLAARGLEVTAVDPAAASLDVARAKPFADRVRFVHGDATSLPPLGADLATMTGNVAQVLLTDEALGATLAGVAGALRPGGHLVVETRDPGAEAWREWTRAAAHRSVEVPGGARVEGWPEVTEVRLPFVSFRWTYAWPDGTVLVSDSTLRFWGRDGMTHALGAAGLRVTAVRDAPDRPGRELVFAAERAGGARGGR